MATPRPNPYSNLNFIVEIDNEEVVGFSEVSGLDSETCRSSTAKARTRPRRCASWAGPRNIRP